MSTFAATTIGNYHGRLSLTFTGFKRRRFHEDTSLRGVIDQIMSGGATVENSRWCVEMLLSKHQYDVDSLTHLRSLGGYINPVEVFYHACKTGNIELFEFGIILLPGERRNGDWAYVQTSISTSKGRKREVYIHELFPSFMQLAISAKSIDMVKYLHRRFDATIPRYHDTFYLDMAIYTIATDIAIYFIDELNYVREGRHLPISYRLAETFNPEAYDRMIRINPNPQVPENRDYYAEYRKMREANLHAINQLI